VAKLRAVEIIPLLTKNTEVDFQPRVPRGEPLEEFWEQILPGSAKRGAKLERKGDRAWLKIGKNR